MPNLDFHVFSSLAVLPALEKDPVLTHLRKAQDAPEKNHLNRARAALLYKAEQLGLTGDLWQEYFGHLLAKGSNLAGKTMERRASVGESLAEALADDLTKLRDFFAADGETVFGSTLFSHYQPSVPAKNKLEKILTQKIAAAPDGKKRAEILLAHYQQYGRGDMARFEAFCLSPKGKLIGIPDFPHYAWDDILGYEDQKEQLLSNCRHFMAGRPYNNVLSTGSRGTGKSTSIKALLPLFSQNGLRLVQIKRNELHLLSRAMEKAGKIRSHKFIFFFDDLSFDENEQEYKYLKSAIDGGAAPQPDNVMLCATSNRRHLLKETWSDRSDALEAEVFREDADNESISLSDRFGLILHFGAPTQKEYLAIIDHELRKEGIHLDPNELRVLGVRWEMSHSGRNGRIAKQFVQWYLGSH